jgi:hypothetical protein
VLAGVPLSEHGLAVWGGGLACFLADQVGQARDFAPAAVVLGIESSNEYRTDVVQSLYQRYLRRATDAPGLQAWVGLLAKGGTIEQVGQASSAHRSISRCMAAPMTVS